jgi:hypothetical protein
VRTRVIVQALAIVVLLAAGVASAVTPRTVLSGGTVSKVKTLKGFQAELPPGPDSGGPSDTWVTIPDLQLPMNVPAGTRAFWLIQHNGLPLDCLGYDTCKLRIAVDGASAGMFPEGCANQALPSCLGPMSHGPLNAGNHVLQVQVFRSGPQPCLPSTCANWELHRHVGPYEMVLQQVKM